MNELTKENEGLGPVAGCHFTEMGMIFEVQEVGALDEAERRGQREMLNQAGRRLQRFQKCQEWCWGDILVRDAELRLMEDFTAEQLRKMSEPEKEEERLRYVRSHGSVMMGDELADTQYHRYKVAGFYNSRMRIRELTPWHHRVAMDGSGGDAAVAQDWLDRAKANDWSGNRLRAEIAKANKGETDDPAPKHTSHQMEWFGAERAADAALKRVDDMEIDEIHRTMANIERLTAKLTALAAAMATRVAKESLSAAA